MPSVVHAQIETPPDALLSKEVRMPREAKKAVREESALIILLMLLPAGAEERVRRLHRMAAGPGVRSARTELAGSKRAASGAANSARLLGAFLYLACWKAHCCSSAAVSRRKRARNSTVATASIAVVCQSTPQANRGIAMSEPHNAEIDTL